MNKKHLKRHKCKECVHFPESIVKAFYCNKSDRLVCETSSACLYGKRR